MYYNIKIAVFVLCLSIPCLSQTITLNGTAGGRKFDGVGGVSGGGATSVLLKDYPEPQRSQILDLLFKPKFGASMNALYVEIPGDGNATQGTELSHMHTKTDENYQRGYEWWVIREAKKRNAAISLDGVAWGAPYWVGNNSFWSQDCADYYVKWIKGLKTYYGYDMDAVGCKNEWGTSEWFVQTFRTTLNNNGLSKVKIHAFDEAGSGKWNWQKDMNTNLALRNSVDIIGNHTMSEIPTPAAVKKMSDDWGKPIWNTEEHPYTTGYNGALECVKIFNQNYIQSNVTKIMNWYLLASFYPAEPFFNIGPPIEAATPWSGYYKVLPKLWAYAHYCQFVQLGWTYLNGACGNLANGSYVTLTSGTDYSTIIETSGASGTQTLTLNIKGGLSTGKVCVWKSNSTSQFVRQADITPANGILSITLDPNSIYSISTTTGQQKGSYPIVADKAFPFPYHENFEHYSDAKLWGYLPYYTADITGGFELSNGPAGSSKCLRQVIAQKAQSWAPEWMPYTILGDQNWKDYEISADVYLDNGGWAGVMGRISSTGGGYGCNPKGYYMRLSNDGTCSLWASNQTTNGAPGNQITTGKANNVGANQWHNVKLQFSGTTIKGFVDNIQVFSANNNTYGNGMAGLVSGGENNARNTAYFDNLIINSVNGTKPIATVFNQDATPLYKTGPVDCNNVAGGTAMTDACGVCIGGTTSRNTCKALANGTYTIKPVFSGLCVETGNAVLQQTCTNTNQQIWTVNKVGNFYQVQNASTGQYLSYPQAVAGTNLSVSSTTNILWRLEDAGSLGYTLVPSTNLDLAVDVSGANAAPGANLLLWQRTGSTNQEFTFSNAIITGLEDETTSEKVSCYPNPFTSDFTISGTSNFNYNIFDLSGTLVESGKGLNTTIAGGNLVKGIYTVKIQSLSGTKFIKLSKN